MTPRTMTTHTNTNGTVTSYGFKCGRVDTSFGYGTRIESTIDGVIARADSGYSTLYEGRSVTAARNACRAYGRLARKYWHADYFAESIGTGESYIARIRKLGVIIGTGPTLHAAMLAAHAFESN